MGSVTAEILLTLSLRWKSHGLYGEEPRLIWCAKSFSLQTQLRLCKVVLRLSWGLDNIGIVCVLCINFIKQAGAVLGQARLKLGLDFTSINLHFVEQDILLSR